MTLIQRFNAWIDRLEIWIDENKNPRASMSLDEMIDSTPKYRWTENEIVLWLESIDEDERFKLIEAARKAKKQKLDAHKFMCDARYDYENKTQSGSFDWIQYILGWQEGVAIAKVANSKKL